MLGDDERAESSYHKAIERLEALSAESVHGRKYCPDLVRSHLGLGILLMKEDRLREASDELRAADGLRGPLEAPSDTTDRQLLATIDYQRGVLLAREVKQHGLSLSQGIAEGRSGREAYQRAITVQEELVRESQNQPERLAKLGRYLNNLGKLLLEDEQVDAAEDCFSRAMELVKAPDAQILPGPRWQYARAAYNLGTLRLDRGKRQEGLDLIRESKNRLVRLNAEFPTVPRYQHELALVCSSLGQAQDRGQGDRAEDDLTLAIELFGRLMGRFPRLPVYISLHARASLTRAVALSTTDAAAAGSIARNAIRHLEGLAHSHPDVSQYQSDLGRAYQQLAIVLRKDPAAARTAAMRTVRLHEVTTQMSPKSRAYRRWLRDAHVVLSFLLIDAGQIEEAARGAEELPRHVPDDILTYQQAARLLTRCAEASKDKGADYKGSAVRLIRKAVEQHVINDIKQLDLPEFRPSRTGMTSAGWLRRSYLRGSGDLVPSSLAKSQVRTLVRRLNGTSLQSLRPGL